MTDLQWKFEPGEWDEDALQLTDEERAELAAEGLPENRWLAEWNRLHFIVTEQQVSYEDGTFHAFVLRTADYSPDVAYPSGKPWWPYSPRLGTAVEFPALAEAQRYAQKMCDDMGHPDLWADH